MIDPHPMTIDELRAEAGRLDRTSSCARPGCQEAVHFRTGVRGRKQRFCSDACRAAFSRKRNQLHKLLGRIEATCYLAAPRLPDEEVELLRAHVMWLLEGYGGVDEFLKFDGMSPLPFPSWEAVWEDHARAKAVHAEELEDILRLQAEQPEPQESASSPRQWV